MNRRFERRSIRQRTDSSAGELARYTQEFFQISTFVIRNSATRRPSHPFRISSPFQKPILDFSAACHGVAFLTRRSFSDTLAAAYAEVEDFTREVANSLPFVRSTMSSLLSFVSARAGTEHQRETCIS